MGLVLGQVESNFWLDDFMAREGYIAKERLYHRVIGCWCGNDSLNPLSGLFGVFEHYQLCEKCGCLLLKKVLSEQGLEELYGMRYFREHPKAIGLPTYEHRYESDAYDRIPTWIRTIKEVCDRGRVLEIGCSHGRFVEELSNVGYDVVGLELDHEICEWARKKTGCDIRCETVDNLGDERFDVVFSNDVLEHILNPEEFVYDVSKVLIPGGKALFQTVIFDEWQQVPIEMMRPLFHTILYSKKSLKLLENSISSFLHDFPSVFHCSIAVFVRNIF
jgi:SAM-dependent methyltransferase